MDRQRPNDGIDAYVDRLLKLSSFKASFTEKIYFLAGQKTMNEMISEYESGMKSDDPPEKVRYNNEVLFGLKIYRMACLRSHKPKNESISFIERLTRLKTILQIDEDFERIFQEFETEFRTGVKYGTTAPKISFESYAHWTFCLHGITQIHEIHKNFSKAFDWYIKFLSFISVPRCEFFSFEEDYLYHFYAPLNIKYFDDKLDAKRQAALKESLMKLFENSREVKDVEFNDFKIKMYYSYGHLKKSLKYARQALKNVRNFPKIVANYEAKILRIRTSNSKIPNDRDFMKLHFMEMGLKVEDQILLQIAWIHEQLANYDLALQTLLKIGTDYVKDIVSLPYTNLVVKPFILYQLGKVCLKLKQHERAKNYFCSSSMLFCRYMSEMADGHQHRICDFGIFFGEHYVLSMIYFQANYLTHVSIARMEFNECQKEISPSRTMSTYLDQKKKIRLKLNSALISRRINNFINVYPIMKESLKWINNENDQATVDYFLRKTLCPKRKSIHHKQQNLELKLYL